MSPLEWQKSTYSSEASNCVELAATSCHVHLRESDAPAAVLTSDAAQLRALLDAAKSGALDGLAR